MASDGAAGRATLGTQGAVPSSSIKRYQRRMWTCVVPNSKPHATQKPQMASRARRNKQTTKNNKSNENKTIKTMRNYNK